MDGRRSESNTNEEDHSSGGCKVVEIRQGDVVHDRTHSSHNNKETLSATTLLNESYFSGRFWRGNRDEYMQKTVI